MREEPDPAVLHPEVAAQGSLAAALQAAAADQGFSLAMVATPPDPLRHATIASVLPHRRALYVAASEDGWLVSASANNGLLIRGTAPDLHQIPKVVLGWAVGASLDDIAQAVPFDILTGRFEVPDGNLADVVAAEWQYRLKHAQQSDWPEYQRLIEAAFAEPKLRELYPTTTHWMLSFSATPWPFTPSFVILETSAGGDYRVIYDGPTIVHAATAAEAISMAVDRIPQPPGQGMPPTQGTD